MSWKVAVTFNKETKIAAARRFGMLHHMHCTSSLPPPWMLLLHSDVVQPNVPRCLSDGVSCVVQLYAESKAMGEKAVLDACSDSLLTVAIAPHQIYGPRCAVCSSSYDTGRFLPAYPLVQFSSLFLHPTDAPQLCVWLMLTHRNARACSCVDTVQGQFVSPEPLGSGRQWAAASVRQWKE